MRPLPLRASSNDADFDPGDFVGLVVKLDGVEQPASTVMAYDIPAGSVTRVVLDDAGHLQIAPGCDEIWVETVFGIVEVSRD